jgi:8-oxo-dGTP pyrophosphatase MutT (NUDIX family)
MSFNVTASLIHRKISLSQFLSSRAKTTKLSFGVLIFRNDKVLILQRAANGIHYPNIWELPSGKVESKDATLLNAAARECFEETGLIVTEFIKEAESFEYTIEGRGWSLQLNFEVNVREEDDVKICPEEHQAYKWHTEKDIQDTGLTEATKRVVENAFRSHRYQLEIVRKRLRVEKTVLFRILSSCV